MQDGMIAIMPLLLSPQYLLLGFLHLVVALGYLFREFLKIHALAVLLSSRSFNETDAQIFSFRHQFVSAQPGNIFCAFSFSFSYEEDLTVSPIDSLLIISDFRPTFSGYDEALFVERILSE
ncbi:hypothetical protein BKA69DRAFT_1078157 [Paraphysoderma sedebokerense]|nr:hypothetical protein BKA69DRAFT_1078157 [Paraphysoderma sedebokerense]